MSDTMEGLVTGDMFDNDSGYQTCDLYLAAFFLSAGSKIGPFIPGHENKTRIFCF